MLRLICWKTLADILLTSLARTNEALDRSAIFSLEKDKDLFGLDQEICFWQANHIFIRDRSKDMFLIWEIHLLLFKFWLGCEWKLCNSFCKTAGSSKMRVFRVFVPGPPHPAGTPHRSIYGDIKMSNHRKYWAGPETKIIECLQNMPINFFHFPLITVHRILMNCSWWGGGGGGGEGRWTLTK